MWKKPSILIDLLFYSQNIPNLIFYWYFILSQINFFI